MTVIRSKGEGNSRSRVPYFRGVLSLLVLAAATTSFRETGSTAPLLLGIGSLLHLGWLALELGKNGFEEE